jgi:lipoprotein-releasing system ATP-binding protein
MANSRAVDGPALVVRNLVRTFPTPTNPLVVLEGVSFELEARSTLSIVGPSGCGKSTLLHILGTLDRPTRGDVVIRGTDPFALDEPELARFRNRQIGFVFQDHHLLPQLTVLENVLIPSLASESGDDRRASVEDRAMTLLDRVGIRDRASHVPAELSGGERQRAAIARALVMQPSVVLCDEPTGNLDQRTAATIGELLLEAHEDEGVVLVVVTHSPTLAARCDRRGELVEGRLRLD